MDSQADLRKWHFDLGLNLRKPVFGVSSKVKNCAHSKVRYDIFQNVNNKCADQTVLMSAQAGLRLCCLQKHTPSSEDPKTGFLALKTIFVIR